MTRTEIRKRYLAVVNKTLNRLTRAIARTGHGPFTLVRHTGRKSGRTFETPIIVARVPEGFMAEPTYGEQVNWYRNAVVAGGCVIVRGRQEHQVVSIESCDPDHGRAAYPPPLRLVLRALGREEFRLLRTAPSIDRGTPEAPQDPQLSSQTQPTPGR